MNMARSTGRPTQTEDVVRFHDDLESIADTHGALIPEAGDARFKFPKGLHVGVQAATDER